MLTGKSAKRRYVPESSLSCRMASSTCLIQEETHIILFEPGTTLNKGNLHDERTVADLQRL